MNQKQIKMITQWIIENVSETDVPSDEGCGPGLVYNLVHLAREGQGYKPYNYESDQDAEIASWPGWQWYALR